MLTTAEFRTFLNRNPNALGAKRIIPAGAEVTPGLYWDLVSHTVEAVARPQPAAHDCVRLSDDLHATLGQVSRTCALGGGGPSGTPLPQDTGLALTHASS